MSRDGLKGGDLIIPFGRCATPVAHSVATADREVYGHLWAYGIWDGCIVLLALAAGLSLLAGGGFGRVFAYIWAILVIVQSFLIIGQAPWHAALMILLAVLVIYGLASTSARAGQGAGQ